MNLADPESPESYKHERPYRPPSLPRKLLHFPTVKPIETNEAAAEQVREYIENTLNPMLVRFRESLTPRETIEARYDIINAVAVRILGEAAIKCGEAEARYKLGGMKAQAQGCRAACNAILKFTKEFLREI